MQPTRIYGARFEGEIILKPSFKKRKEAKGRRRRLLLEFKYLNFFHHFFTFVDVRASTPLTSPHVLSSPLTPFSPRTPPSLFLSPPLHPYITVPSLPRYSLASFPKSPPHCIPSLITAPPLLSPSSYLSSSSCVPKLVYFPLFLHLFFYGKGAVQRRDRKRKNLKTLIAPKNK